MASLAQRLYTIKTSTGGYLEKWEFEWTYIPAKQALNRIAMPNPENNRIFGQLEFALKLSETNNDKFDSEIDTALHILENSLEKQGVLTRDACNEAEKTLLPLKSIAKEYTVLCAAHAHIDMNWMWGWQETVASTLATFRTMLFLMNDYPDYTFSQSQASVYRIVEKYDPEMMEEIKQRIKEGRWEVTASNWVETDKNMPNTESLLRHIRYTKDYLADNWGVDPAELNIDFLPDTFGHSAHIPEINNYGGVKYLYHCRGLEEHHVLYRWRSPSGSEILAYRDPLWYNSGINSDVGIAVFEVASLCAGLKTSLFVYGVGNHGGGPTRKDIEQILEMADWPVFPVIKFGTFHEYFKAAETVRDKLPVVDREINFILTGCYTTQSRIKMGNRLEEASLLDAEVCDTLSSLLTGKHYSQELYTEAWRDLLFTHFHDILTGSCKRDSREYAMGLYANIMAVSQTMREKASLNIAQQIDTSSIQIIDAEGTRSEGAGAGFGIENYRGIPSCERGRGHTRIFHIFNPAASTRNENVELTVWDWVYDMRRIELIDASGKILPFQLLDKEQINYWAHMFFRLIVPIEVPGFGYTTVVLKEAEMGKQYPFYFNHIKRDRIETSHKPVILENEFIRVEFDCETGALCSLYDKKSGMEQIAENKKAGLMLNWAEKNPLSAWQIGQYLAHEPVVRTSNIIKSTDNLLRNSLEFEQQILSSRIKTLIYLDRDSHALAYDFTIIWNEAAESHANVPVLCFSVPLGNLPGCFQSDVPGGIQRRPAETQDHPGLRYMAAVNGPDALALITDSKYGYRGKDESLSVTLINTAFFPDPFPERGEHNIRLWITPTSSNPGKLAEISGAFCHPVNVISGGKHNGKLPLQKEIVKFEADSTVMSSLGLADKKTILVRGYETAGKPDRVKLTMPNDIAAAQFVDLEGKTVNANTKVNGSSVSFEIAPNRIFGILVTFH